MVGNIIINAGVILLPPVLIIKSLNYFLAFYFIRQNYVICEYNSQSWHKTKDIFQNRINVAPVRRRERDVKSVQID